MKYIPHDFVLDNVVVVAVVVVVVSMEHYLCAFGCMEEVCTHRTIVPVQSHMDWVRCIDAAVIVLVVLVRERYT